MDHPTKQQLDEWRTDLEQERDRLKSRLGLIDHDLADGLAHDVGDQQDVPAGEATRLAERGTQDHARKHLGRIEAALHRIEGGDTILVQTGDQLDRGDGEPEILAMLDALTVQAKAEGGEVHVLNGNHEFINAAGDMRYVTPDGLADYARFADKGEPRSLTGQPVDPEAKGRVVAFQPGGPEAPKLPKRPIVKQVGRSVFVHAGLTPQYVTYGVDKLNEESQAWLRGERKEIPMAAFDTDNGPVRTRRCALDVDARDCQMASDVLRRMEADRMVVGHTVQEGGITPKCAGKIWLIDVGMSAHYGGKPQTLEIRDGKTRIMQGG